MQVGWEKYRRLSTHWREIHLWSPLCESLRQPSRIIQVLKGISVSELPPLHVYINQMNCPIPIHVVPQSHSWSETLFDSEACSATQPMNGNNFPLDDWKSHWVMIRLDASLPSAKRRKKTPSWELFKSFCFQYSLPQSVLSVGSPHKWLHASFHISSHHHDLGLITLLYLNIFECIWPCGNTTLKYNAKVTASWAGVERI